MPLNGCGTWFQPGLSRLATWMRGTYEMSNPMTSAATPNATSSQALEAGRLPSASLDGLMTGLCGQGAPRANHFRVPEKAKEAKTRGTCGLLFTNSSEHVGLKSSSANRLQVRSQSERRVCKGCQEEKPIREFREHNRGGWRWTCRTCENRWVRTTKPWESASKKDYQRGVRRTRRMLNLVSDAKQRAKRKGLAFDLDWKALQVRLDRGVCEVTGIPFDLSIPKAWNAPSLDRIVPNLGYTMENTRIVLLAVNVMASDWGLGTALRVADAIRLRRAV